MQFLISVISNANERANDGEMIAIDAYNDLLQANGHWVYANGISSPDEAKLIDNRDNAGIVLHSPLHQAQEFIAGFWIISAQDHATAQSLALEGSLACNRKVEVRQLHGS